MNRLTGIVAIFGIYLSVASAAENGDLMNRFTTLLMEYEERKAGISSDQSDLDSLYLRELKELEKKAIDAGDLELVVATRDAAKKFAAGKRDSSISVHPELARMQKIYADQTARITAERSTKLKLLAKEYRAKLIDLRIKLTRGNEIDNALKVQEEIERLDKGIPARPVATDSPRGATWGFEPGLMVSEYHRVEKQTKNEGFVRFSELRAKPVVGEKRQIKTLQNWNYEPGKNAIAAGYLKIDQPGEYQFSSNSFYDRNALYVLKEDQPLCGYRDGEGKIQKINLSQGMVRIISIGYVDARGSCNVRWIPPGETKLSPIPGSLLFHTTADKQQ